MEFPGNFSRRFCKFPKFRKPLKTCRNKLSRKSMMLPFLKLIRYTSRCYTTKVFPTQCIVNPSFHTKRHTRDTSQYCLS